MPDYQEILSGASKLPIDDRLRLIDDIASSVPDDRPPNLSPEWLAEINRRSDEMDAGTVASESWSVIRNRLFTKYGIQDGN